MKDFKSFFKGGAQLSNREIISIVDGEIEKSKNFGLDILLKDQRIEKNIILNIFRNIHIKPSTEYSDLEFSQTLSSIKRKVKDELDEQLRFYFENTPHGQVRNRYQCHIEDVVNAIFFTITYK